MNPHEHAARTVKATKLADVLSAAHAKADDLEFMSEFGWGNAAAAARVALPSATTREMVRRILAAREATMVGADLYEAFQ